MKPRFFLTLMLMSMSAVIAFGQDVDHVFSNEKSDSGQDYHANPKNDLHQTFTTIREVKLKPEQFKKLTGKEPSEYKKAHPTANAIRMTNREYHDLMASNDTVSAPEDTTASDVIAVIGDQEAVDTAVTPMPGPGGYRSWNSHTINVFGSIFSLLALLGMFVIVLVLSDRRRPHTKTIIIGLLATLLDTVFIMFVVHHWCIGITLTAFLIAAVSAATLLFCDMNDKPLPRRLVTALGAIGVLAAIAMVVWVMMR